MSAEHSPFELDLARSRTSEYMDLLTFVLVLRGAASSAMPIEIKQAAGELADRVDAKRRALVERMLGGEAPAGRIVLPRQ